MNSTAILQNISKMTIEYADKTDKTIIWSRLFHLDNAKGI